MWPVEFAPSPRTLFRADDAPENVLVAISERGQAPDSAPSPTAWLARRFAEDLGLPDLAIVRASQVHGARVATITEAPPPGATVDAGACDAMVTRLSGVALVVQTADCVPVLLATDGAIGAVHAGWRGAAAGVVRAATEALSALGADPERTRAWLGPAIGACCYEVGEEVARLFPDRFAQESTAGKLRLDLPGIVAAQLAEAGIVAQNVTADPSCTKCGGARFASYRRDRENAGRMIALVARLGAARPSSD